jgi:hypothetical protein
MFFDDYLEPPSKRSKFHGELKRLTYAPVERPLTPSPFNLPVGSATVFDSEVFGNYYLAAFKHIESGLYFYIEHSGSGPLPDGKREALHRAIYWFKIISFNGIYYDMPIVEAAIKYAPLEQLKRISDEIILEDKRLANPNAKYNHIDLIEVAPLEASLKAYGARLHTRRIQDLPIDPHKALTPQNIEDVRDYCFNDLDNTELLYAEPQWGLKQYIELRERLGERYGIDLRSKSDAQVAEAVINSELRKLTGRYPKRPDFDDFLGFTFQYEAPQWVQFQTPMLRDVLSIVQGASFTLDGGGSPQMPEAIAELKVKIADNVYKMGMGGLHSQEKSVAYRADEETYLIDRDVAGYYPRIILNNRYYPEHLGEVYLEAYGERIVEERLRLKAMKDPLSDGMKIASNGIFGKQGNMYSTVYAPKLLIQTTMTGQLGLLLLIEAVVLANFEVVSANTDGFVTKVPKTRLDDFNAILADWEQRTGFLTEETRYAALYSRDVNNYIAVKEDGTCKVKGAYSERGSALNSPLSKNPEAMICSDAVQAFLTVGKSIEETIRECRDVRRFVVVRNVRGGGHKDGWYLGKVVRWYYAEGVTGIIQYVTSGNKVSNSEGAKPLMELNGFPDDVNYSYYLERAYSILEDIGYANKGRQGSLF